MSRQQNQIVLRDFNRTSSQDNVFSPECIVSYMQNCTPQYPGAAGVLTMTQKLNGVIFADEIPGITAMVPKDVFETYLFGTDNKVYLYDELVPSVTLLHTLNPTTGDKVAYNVKVYNGYLYYAMEDYLGRMDLATGTFNDTWQAFTNGEDGKLHVMTVVNRDLYIADADLVAIVDTTGTFTANALDIDPDYSIRALYCYDTSLIIGASMKDDDAPRSRDSRVYVWNTWSVSFDSDSVVPEPLVHGIMVVNGGIYILAEGTKIRIYQYGDVACQIYTTLPERLATLGIRDIFGSDSVHPSSVTNVNGMWYFGVHNQGVWSFGSIRAGYPPTVQWDHVMPGYDNDQGASFDVQVFCILAVTNSRRRFGVKFTPLIAESTPAMYEESTTSSRYCLFTTGLIRVSPDEAKDFSISAKVGIFEEPTGLEPTMQITARVNGIIDQIIDMEYDQTRRLFTSPTRVAPCGTVQFQVAISRDSASNGVYLEELVISFD